MSSLVINVLGTPVPQGSKVANRFGHGVRDANAKRLAPWRSDVAAQAAATAEQSGWVTLDGPIEVVMQFFHKRPASHYGTGRNAGVLKPSAPRRWKATTPDADKLARAVCDALTAARVIRDDSRIARLVVEDEWADAATGARITVRALDDGLLPTAALPSRSWAEEAMF